MERKRKGLGQLVPFILVIEAAVILSLGAVALIGGLAAQMGVPQVSGTLDAHGVMTLVNIAMIMLIWSISTYGAARIWQLEGVV